MTLNAYGVRVKIALASVTQSASQTNVIAK